MSHNEVATGEEDEWTTPSHSIVSGVSIVSYQTNIHDGVTGQIHAAHGHGCYIYILTLTITASKCMNKRILPIILV